MRYLVGADRSALPPTMLVRGRPAAQIGLSDLPVTLGRDPTCDVILPSSEVAPVHASIARSPHGPVVEALNPTGESRLNGRHFDRHTLVLGDQLELGNFLLRYDGSSLQLLDSSNGAAISADALSVSIRERRILDRIALRIAPNEFVGIIGPTGAGKSTLLAALSGQRPLQAGRVRVGGHDLLAEGPMARSLFGWVPQQDIVHRELTVSQALSYAARLRLPRDTPEPELGRLVVRTANQLGLEPYLGTSISQLSGGEVKKVSVAAELLSRPPVLFLDEPTSGLDPGAEAQLMVQLRQLADSGCTVVCTTHVMQSLYLLDRLVVLSHGLLIFSGSPEKAKEFFGVQENAAIFDRIGERKATEWRDAFRASEEASGAGAGESSGGTLSVSRRKKPAFQVPLLIRRQGAIFSSDWRNLLIMLGQPVFIGLLLVWAVRATVDDTSLKLFFISVATLWFGCSNGAQAIVSELPIYRRERMIGLRRDSYVLAKWIFLGAITLLQSAILFAIAGAMFEASAGNTFWQAAGLATMALVATGIGLAISAFARSAMQAVMLVPVLIIPQIVLSGFTVPASVMRPSVLAVSQAIPSFQLQRIMDVSLLWEREIDATSLQNHLQAFQNLSIRVKLQLGETFADPEPGAVALGILGGWVIALFLLTLVALSRREQV